MAPFDYGVVVKTLPVAHVLSAIYFAHVSWQSIPQHCFVLLLDLFRRSARRSVWRLSFLLERVATWASGRLGRVREAASGAQETGITLFLSKAIRCKRIYSASASHGLPSQ